MVRSLDDAASYRLASASSSSIFISNLSFFSIKVLLLSDRMTNPFLLASIRRSPRRNLASFQMTRIETRMAIVAMAYSHALAAAAAVAGSRSGGWDASSSAAGPPPNPAEARMANADDAIPPAERRTANSDLKNCAQLGNRRSRQ